MSTTTKTPFDWSSLVAFVGSGDKFRGTFVRWILHTEGMQHVCTECQCFWLLDVVASHQTKRAVRAERFQLWRIERGKRNPSACTVTCRRDTNDKPVVTQRIPFTDFPFPENGVFEFYAVHDGQHLTIMLKSEY